MSRKRRISSKRGRNSTISVVVLAVIALINVYNYYFSESNDITGFDKASVTKHVDGDTIYVRLENGEEEKIRMIGVNTPETKHPTKGVEAYGKEASDFTREYLKDRVVYLEKDVSDRDRYNRLLRYVWLEVPENKSDEEISGKLFNAILVKEGYANVSTFPPDVKYEDVFLMLEGEARENNMGLWGMQKIH